MYSSADIASARSCSRFQRSTSPSMPCFCAPGAYADCAAAEALPGLDSPGSPGVVCTRERPCDSGRTPTTDLESSTRYCALRNMYPVIITENMTCARFSATVATRIDADAADASRAPAVADPRDVRDAVLHGEKAPQEDGRWLYTHRGQCYLTDALSQRCLATWEASPAPRAELPPPDDDAPEELRGLSFVAHSLFTIRIIEIPPCLVPAANPFDFFLWHDEFDGHDRLF